MSRRVSIIILQLAFVPNSALAETACEFSQHARNRYESLQCQYDDFEESIYHAEIDAKRDRGNVSIIQSRSDYHNHTVSENRWNVGTLSFTLNVSDVAVYICNFKHHYVPLLVIIVFYLFRRIKSNNDRRSPKTSGLDPRRCAAVHSVAVHVRFSQDETLRPPCRARGGSPMKLCIGSPPIHKLDVFVNGDCPQMRDSQVDSYFRRLSTAARLRRRRQRRRVLPQCAVWSGIETDE